MTYTPFTPKFKSGQIIKLNRSMSNFYGDYVGTYSKGHEFKVVGVHIDQYYNWRKRYGTMIALEDMDGDWRPYLYTLQDSDNIKRLVVVEEQELTLVTDIKSAKPETIVNKNGSGLAGKGESAKRFALALRKG